MPDFLLEIGCEEIPADGLEFLAMALSKSISEELQHAELAYKEITHFATPRRLAVLVTDLVSDQPSQMIERFGPSLEQAFDKNNRPSAACIGFARSCGVEVSDLQIKTTPKGERMYFLLKQSGAPTLQLLPKLITTAIKKLPLTKSMRWGDNSIAFIRPVHWVVMLYGDTLVSAQILGRNTTQATFGHRFHSPEALTVIKPSDYLNLLEQHHVIADFQIRKEKIHQQILQIVSKNDQAILDPKLLDEVAGLVEWPVALKGKFAEKYLKIPKEVLMTSMQQHQKCFPVENLAGKLQSYFILISNIDSIDATKVIEGNERVIHARLSDAEFFYHQDLKHTLESRLTRLKQVIFQKQLGTLFEKCHRLVHLSEFIARSLTANVELAKRAALLCKCDLVSDMVGEFPNLQGVMGYYYALHEGESAESATAIKEHYYPRFAGDQIPTTTTGCIVALADRLDTLIGIFGIHQAPTGDKDPYALRRAALGIIRILIEKQWPLDLMQLLQQTVSYYSEQNISLPNKEVINKTFDFIMARMKAWYLEQNTRVEIFDAVAARHPTQPVDFDRRIQAVKQFLDLKEANSLTAANKRVGNILKKISIVTEKIDASLLESEAEKNLAHLLETQTKIVAELYKNTNYTEALHQLSTLKEPVDLFFDKIMVMVDDEKIRNNRLVLLNSLHKLLTQVADISLL